MTDPNLGLLTQDRRGWSGHLPWPDSSQRISLRIESTGEPPNDSVGTAVWACLGNYSTLSGRLRSAPFSLWQPYVAQRLWEEEWPTSPEMLWAQLKLDGIEVQRSGEIVLLYAFKGEVWPDAIFSVQVSGADVHPLHLDD
ncbi:hypothetical protein ACVC7V_22820 [Hydrogenophaga sp. A37]|uniref:hypothetical protein n=1 Tax=Hydrogenophaga sp. A37 TaxID=1945864 RepID=UPI0011799825|nr:hypothetical protein [Hydrogenophaga sp. A37]